jgi:hypothetical protein
MLLSLLLKVPLRFMVRCAREAFDLFGAGLFNQLVTSFDRHHHSSYLFLAGELVIELGRTEALKPILMESVTRLSNLAFAYFGQDFNQKVVDSPDVVDDFFLMIRMALVRLPEALIASPIFPTSLQLAVACMVVEHREALKSTLYYIMSFCELASSDQPAIAYTVQGLLRVCALFFFSPPPP